MILTAVVGNTVTMFDGLDKLDVDGVVSGTVESSCS